MNLLTLITTVEDAHKAGAHKRSPRRHVRTCLLCREALEDAKQRHPAFHGATICLGCSGYGVIADPDDTVTPAAWITCPKCDGAGRA